MHFDKPIFILGNPRSGTTLFRLMLNNHPHITIPPECGFIEWWFWKYADWRSEDIYTNRLNEFISDLSSSKKIETWKIDFSYIRQQICYFKPESYANLCSIINYCYGVLKGKNELQRWGDKNNYYISICDKLLKIYPSAQFIHVIRDGRDVAASYMELSKLNSNSIYKPVLPVDIRQIADQWVTNLEKCNSFFEKLSKKNRTICKYETLIKNTESELERICDFLSLNFDKNMLTYYIDNLNNAVEPIETMDWKQKTLLQPDVQNLGRFKAVLTNEEISVFERIADKFLKLNNYL